MYECACNMMKSLQVIKMTNFDQNQFLTLYLILNLRPTYFSYFRKISAISISHNVKKRVDQNLSQGVHYTHVWNLSALFSHNFTQVWNYKNIASFEKILNDYDRFNCENPDVH